MKRILTALSISILIAGLFFTQVAASASSSVQSASSCGDTYTVTGGDSLSKIAGKCGVSLATILSLNPQITDANLVYTGQVIRLTSSADYSITQISPLTWFYSYYYGLGSNTTTNSGSYYTNYSGSAQITISDTSVEPGDWITVYVSGFPANADIDYRIGEKGKNYTDVYDGVINGDGKDEIKIDIPAAADDGEYWVVEVVTTSQANVVSVISPSIYITDEDDGYHPDVDVSDTTVSAGDTITVSVSGFPAGADIDYRIGKENEHYTAVYDGSIGSDGKDSITITIPDEAGDGERWIIYVPTTSQVNMVDAYSPILHIDN